MQPTPTPSRFRQLRAIAGATLLETMQQPAVLLLLLAGVMAVALVPVMQFHQFGETGRLARDGGMAYTLLVGLAIAVTAAGSAISRECDGGTASVALSRPVARGMFIAGKFLGVLGILFLFWIAMTASTLLAERVSRLSSFEYAADGAPRDLLTPRLSLFAAPAALAIAAALDFARRARFGAAAFHGIWIATATVCLAVEAHSAFAGLAGGGFALDWRIVPASLLVFAALAVFASLATMLATRLRPAATLAVCAAAFMVGLSADAIAAAASARGLRLPLWIIPNLRAFWRADDLASGGTVPMALVASGMAYAASWCGLALLAGAALFRRRDLQ